jgi:hypothetical protein
MYCTSCGPSAFRIDLGERNSLSSTSDLRKAYFQRRFLSEVKTELATIFFSVLIDKGVSVRLMSSYHG